MLVLLDNIVIQYFHTRQKNHHDKPSYDIHSDCFSKDIKDWKAHVSSVYRSLPRPSQRVLDSTPGGGPLS